jgi:hypothetical protein
MRVLRGHAQGRKAGRLRASVTLALIVLMTIASGISAAEAVPVAGPGSGVHGSAQGTIAARTGPGTRATVRHAAAAAQPDATGALSTVVSQTVNGGYTAAGIGMRNLGSGTISITGVPAGATVKSATLLWDILADQADPAFTQGTVNGNPVSGTEWASGASPCWSSAGSNWSYEADVTSQVTGNGSYAMAGFATGETDGADPWNVGSAPPLLEGASLVVVYELASMPQAVIQIAEGAAETNGGSEADATLDGFTVSAPASATTTYIVADGQEAGNTAAFNGAALPDVSFPGADPMAVPNYSLGNLWDTATTDVSSLVSPGDTSAALAVTGNDDCLVWVGQVLSVSSSCTTTVAFGLYKATAEDGSCLVKNGQTYTDTGPVNLNGLDLVPNSGVVSIDTASGHEELSADDAKVMVGSFQIFSGHIPVVGLNRKFSLQKDAEAKIGGVKLSGNIDLTASGSDGLDVTGSMTLPQKLGSADVAFTATLNTADGLEKVGMSASSFFIPVRSTKVGLKAFSLSYDLATDVWTGGATVGLPTPAGAEVAASIEITRGSVTKFSAKADNLNKPLGPDGVFLESIGAELALAPPPPSITGTASITAGPQIKGKSAMSIDGSLGFIFSDPGELQMKGSLKLLKGSSFGTTLANGELDYFTDGHITASGEAKVSLGNIAFHAGLNGWVSGTTAFSLTGSGRTSIGSLNLTKADGVVSKAGIAACGRLFGDTGPSVGFGYLWGGKVHVMESSCGLGPYTSQSQVILRPDTGVAASAVVTLPAGLPVASMRITGNNGTAPAGTLTDPNGHSLAIDPAHQGAFTGTSPKYGLGVDEGIDYVVIDAPAGGRWAFTPASGSSVKSLSTAQGLPKPALSATVSGAGLHRRLAWKIARLPGQKVTFVEEAPGVDHVLASSVSAHSGRVAFTPADGPAGKRGIFAVVTQNGLTRQTVRVATYTAPATASLQVTVQHAQKGRGTIKIAPGGGTCRSTCSLSVRKGQLLTLTPVPGHGSKFSWTQGLCSGSGTCKLTVAELTAVTGKFVP